MAKKSAKLPLIYLIGMALVLVGFCCPMFKGKLLGSTSNGFNFINFDNSGFVTIGALCIFVGAVLGVLACFLPQLSICKMVGLVVSIVGGVILVIGFTTNGGIYKVIGKGFLKHAYIGFYMIVAGWVVALAGFVTKK